MANERCTEMSDVVVVLREGLRGGRLQVDDCVELQCRPRDGGRRFAVSLRNGQNDKCVFHVEFQLDEARAVRSCGYPTAWHDDEVSPFQAPRRPSFRLAIRCLADRFTVRAAGTHLVPKKKLFSFFPGSFLKKKPVRAKRTQRTRCFVVSMMVQYRWFLCRFLLSINRKQSKYSTSLAISLSRCRSTAGATATSATASPSRWPTSSTSAGTSTSTSATPSPLPPLERILAGTCPPARRPPSAASWRRPTWSPQCSKITRFFTQF